MGTGRADFIIPECYIDTNLVETLVRVDGCNHQKGCNQVAKVMQDRFSDRFAVGVIDADKRRPAYLDEFGEIAASEHITVYGHGKKKHYIVLVRPAMDGFVLACAETAGLNMAEYGLPSVLKEFTRESKNVMTNKDVRFRRLFKAMEATGEMKLMKMLMEYLATRRYDAEDAEIAELF